MKFEQMVEPFNVRVEKIKGSTRQEIALPPSDNGPGGVGLAKDQVRELQTWLLNEWSGGGNYAFSIIDSSVPPQSMEWTAFYSPNEFPEKIPPTMQAATMPVASASPSVPAPTQISQGRPMATYPGGMLFPPASLYAQSQPQPQPAPASAPTYGYYGHGYVQPAQAAPAPYGSDLERRRLEETVNEMRAQLQQREFDQRLANIESRYEKRHSELQQLIQQMGEKLVANVKPAIDPGIESQRETIRRLEEKIQQQAEQTVRDQRERELREMINRMNDDMKRVVAESNQRLETFMREASNKGPNEQMMLFQSMFQSQNEAMKEIARNNQSQLERMQNFALRPQDVLAIAKESSNGVDQVTRQMNHAWADMFGISRQLIEQVAQLNQGGGNEVVGLVREGLGKIGDWAERYTGGEARKSVAQSNAQAEVARAQAEAIKAQNDRLSEQARIEYAMRTGQVVQRPDGTFVAPGNPQASIPPSTGPTEVPKTNGTNGAKVSAPWVPPKTPRTNGANKPPVEQAVNQGLNGAQAQETSIDTDETRRKGRTDAEWFGPMMPDVQKLRGAVNLFIEGLKRKPPEKIEGSAAPQDTAMAIVIASQELAQRQIAIPAIVDLLMQGMVPDFLDVLLPDSPQAYRDDVVQILMQMGGADEEDEDDEEDDEAEVAAS